MPAAREDGSGLATLCHELDGGQVVTCIAERPGHLTAMLSDAVAAAPRAVALVDGARRLSYRDLECEVAAARALAAASPATLTLGDGGAHGHTVGRPALCGEICVVGEDGRPAAAGESGEIWIRRPQVSPGYWNPPEATEAAFIEGCWRSGDIGVIEGQGWLQPRDRMKELINRGGYKIYSPEIEHALVALDAVVEAAVGRRDPMLGEKSHAVIVLRGDQLSAAQVRAHRRALISDCKIPEFVTLPTEPLPRNPDGRVLKPQLRERAAQEATAISPSPQAPRDPARRA